LDSNPCWRRNLAPDVESGSALNRGDEFYISDQHQYGPTFYTSSPIPFSVTNGKSRPAKRKIKRDVFFDHAFKIFLENTGNCTIPILEEDVAADEELRMAVASTAPQPSGPKHDNAKTTSAQQASPFQTGPPKLPLARRGGGMTTITRTPSQQTAAATMKGAGYPVRVIAGGDTLEKSNLDLARI
jgi:hypothetical protein